MPELPDLQVFSRNLNNALKGKVLESVTLSVTGKTRASAKELNEALAGKKLKGVERVGKQLCFDFGKDAQLFIHLMLHGRLVLQATEDTLPKHVIASLHFEKQVLFLNDYQKAAHLILNPQPGNGVDALSDELTAKWLGDQLADSRAKIKTLLIDQKVIAGIGNAYADEILWEAGIEPESVAGKIPPVAIRKLAKSISKVLRNAETQILKHHPDLIAGEVRDFLKIHNSRKKQSPTGGNILTTTVGGRKTYYTEEQVHYS